MHTVNSFKAQVADIDGSLIHMLDLFVGTLVPSRKQGKDLVKSGGLKFTDIHFVKDKIIESEEDRVWHEFQFQIVEVGQVFRIRKGKQKSNFALLKVEEIHRDTTVFRVFDVDNDDFETFVGDEGL